jgi:hypothetical protein
MIDAKLNSFKAKAVIAIVVTFAGIASVAYTTVALGHHAAQVTYQMNQIVEVEGEITRLIWRNPHIRFTLSTTDEQGNAEEWNVESIPVTRLLRVGVSSDLVSAGQVVRVAGHPSRRSTNDVYAINLLLSDGREVLLDSSVARWTDDTLGTGQDVTPGTRSFDPSLGIFRVWSTDGIPLALGSLGSNHGFNLTEEGLAAQAAWDPLSLDNPFRGCAPKGVPQIMEQPNPMEFVDQGDEILLRLEEYDTVRVISMLAESPDEAVEPSLLGHSVGRWEGRTLVVETDQISWPYFNQNGLRQSEAIKLLERFTASEDGARLDYELTVTDSTLFTEPAFVTKSWVWVPGDEVLPFDCTEG